VATPAQDPQVMAAKAAGIITIKEGMEIINNQMD
jgi:hypothetical protein